MTDQIGLDWQVDGRQMECVKVAGGSKRGGDVVFREGHKFVKQKALAEGERWINMASTSEQFSRRVFDTQNAGDVAAIHSIIFDDGDEILDQEVNGDQADTDTEECIEEREGDSDTDQEGDSSGEEESQGHEWYLAALVWPQADILGCKFHLSQSWFRKIQNLGLTVKYRDPEDDVGMWLHMSFGLPFLNPDEAQEGFCQWVIHMPLDAAAHRTMDKSNKVDEAGEAAAHLEALTITEAPSNENAEELRKYLEAAKRAFEVARGAGVKPPPFAPPSRKRPNPQQRSRRYHPFVRPMTPAQPVGYAPVTTVGPDGGVG
ncbi:hypothetical protein GE061_000304 [Apolygus lucorum]|uniref:Uncharacterized protein n=1 Tax=Apolygus lucorum TaxID=248454 RepID=A0A8S9Y3Z7_APOLU|nr:hypothetical protein GE061_000304 [Apolygus lucorum]